MEKSTDSITCWIKSFQRGDEAAAEKLWAAFSQRLASFAKSKMAHSQTQAYDEDDAVASAFYSAYVALGKREVIEMNRNDFWSFIATITARKICRQITRNKSQKRNHRPHSVQGELPSDVVIDNAASRVDPPDLMTEFVDQYEHLLSLLPREDLRTIVGLKLDGYTNVEIAGKMERGLSSIERKLKAIREVWEDSLKGDPIETSHI